MALTECPTNMTCRRSIGAARSHVVEQHHPEILGQGRRDQAPQVLIASEAVGEHHDRPILGAGHHDIVPATHTGTVHNSDLATSTRLVAPFSPTR
jgi:hypothetical protein